MSSEERNQLIEDVETFLRNYESNERPADARQLVSADLIERLLAIVKAPLRSECDQQADLVFQLELIHRKVNLVTESWAGYACERCREIWPCETMGAIAVAAAAAKWSSIDLFSKDAQP